MLSFPNAKINLGLSVLRKLPTGFHEIESVFYPIPFSDGLEIIPSNEFKFTTSGIPIDGTTEDNLIYKAHQLIAKEKTPHIHLHKVLPMGAGIGGGSADAAFALKELNKIYNLGLSTQELENLAAKLGSDCPFFIENKPRHCSGTGFVFEEIELNLKGYFLVLLNPEIHVSTKEAYSGIEFRKQEKLSKEIIKQPIETWKNELKNDFETHIFKKYPKIEELKTWLYINNAIYASMTGSGSTVYGIFDSEPELKSDYLVWKGHL